jgi:hypothetical protein
MFYCGNQKSNQGVMPKNKPIKSNLAGTYVWRDSKNGQFTLKIIKPKKGPTSVSQAEIRRAVRDTYATRKAK